MKAKKIVWTIVKIAAVLGINAVILTVLTSDDEKLAPQEAQADIIDFTNIALLDNTTTDVIKGSGLTPRAYEVNGNIVHFAVGETAMSPTEVLDFYQTRFVEAGINDKKWMTNPQQKVMGDEKKFQQHQGEIWEYINAMTDGEVVPYLATRDYVAMGGPVLKGDNFKDIFEEWGWSGIKNPNNVMKGWRFIDAQKTKRGVTRVTSVWADKEFDFEGFNEPNRAQLGVNDSVPACPGCSLLARTKSLQKDEPIALEQYMSQQDPQTVSSFYKRAMTGRGWELSDTTQTMEYAASKVPDHPFNTDGRFLTFAKGSRQVTYTILPQKTGTVVTATENW